MLKNFNFPNQIKYIVGNEAAERFSFYGMKSILIVFMLQFLMIPENESKGIFHTFVSAVYFLPLLGGFLSDRYWGKYKTIMILSAVYCLGHLVLSLYESKPGLYWGLALIALGSGGIKPCVSAHVGDQFNKSNQHLIQKVFDLFYFAINFGSFFSTLLIPKILAVYGPSIAFGIPGVLMALATYIFWLGRKYYIFVPPSGKENAAAFWPILCHGIFHLSERKPGEHFLDTAKSRFRHDQIEGAKAAVGVFKVFIYISLFWALFDQTASTWIIQAQKMERVFLGFTVEAAQVHALNPILVMVLIPVFSFFIYPTVQRFGIVLTPLRKISSGMVLTGFSFLFVGGIQVAIDAGHTVNVAWQFIPYLIITASEIMVSITCLEFSYTQAPRAMKSTMMSLFFLTITMGNLLTATISYLNKFQGSMEFFFYAILMFIVSGFFILSATKYQVRNYIED